MRSRRSLLSASVVLLAIPAVVGATTPLRLPDGPLSNDLTGALAALPTVARRNDERSESVDFDVRSLRCESRGQGSTWDATAHGRAGVIDRCTRPRANGEAAAALMDALVAAGVTPRCTVGRGCVVSAARVRCGAQSGYTACVIDR